MTNDDLSAFLLARIAEDEQVAHACKGQSWDYNRGEAVRADVTGGYDYVACGSHGNDIEGAYASHMVRWDPAHVLAECEAKRRIVDMRQATVLRALALLYREHADYRVEWALNTRPGTR